MPDWPRRNVPSYAPVAWRDFQRLVDLLSEVIYPSTASTGWNPLGAIGNLKNKYGYGVGDMYGAAFGQYANGASFLTIDATNGIRVQNRAGGVDTTVGQWDALGNLALGAVATNQGNAYWNNTTKQFQFRGGANGTVVQAYIDTSGAIMAGGGKVILDASGATLIGVDSGVPASQNRLTFLAATPASYDAGVRIYRAGNQLELEVQQGTIGGAGLIDLSFLTNAGLAQASHMFSGTLVQFGTPICPSDGTGNQIVGQIIGDMTGNLYLYPGAQALKAYVSTGVYVGDTPVDPGANNLSVQGNIGVNVASPAARLEVNETTAATMASLFITARQENGLRAQVIFRTKDSGGTNRGGTIGSSGAIGNCIALRGDAAGLATPHAVLYGSGGFWLGTTPSDLGANNLGVQGVYYVGANQVVGAQGAAVADADGTLASATSQLNALLARLRTHGLIAT